MEKEKEKEEEEGRMDKEKMASSVPSSSSASASSKPVIVRIKRRRFHQPLESIWLELIERPTKRVELDLSYLSLTKSDDQPSKLAGEVKNKTKLLFHRVETIKSFEASEVLKVDSTLRKSKSNKETQGKLKEHRPHLSASKDRKEQLLTAARASHESIARTARFQQVWKSRKDLEKGAEDDTMWELFRLYDVVRVDNDASQLERSARKECAKREAELAEGKLLCNYIPMLREFIPSAATEIEYELSSQKMDEDDYVYDVYATESGDKSSNDDNYHPIVQVVEDGFYDGEIEESDSDSEDSNAENNPCNDYPEEEDDSEPESNSDFEKTKLDDSDEYGYYDDEY